MYLEFVLVSSVVSAVLEQKCLVNHFQNNNIQLYENKEYDEVIAGIETEDTYPLLLTAKGKIVLLNEYAEPPDDQEIIGRLPVKNWKFIKWVPLHGKTSLLTLRLIPGDVEIHLLVRWVK